MSAPLSIPYGLRRAREMARAMATTRKKLISYSKWGYFFIAPFFIIYTICTLVPLLSTFYNSFFENYRIGLTQVGPKFLGFDNYLEDIHREQGPYLRIEYRHPLVAELHTANHRVVTACHIVHEHEHEPQGAAVLQDRYLYAESDHGLRFRHAVLHLVLRRRAHKQYPDGYRDQQGPHSLFGESRIGPARSSAS